MVTMSPCHHDIVSTYYTNPIIMLSVDNRKKASLPLVPVDCELDHLQDGAVP